MQELFGVWGEPKTACFSEQRHLPIRKEQTNWTINLLISKTIQPAQVAAHAVCYLKATMGHLSRTSAMAQSKV